MTSDIPDLNFGPSERYLPGKKLLEGDVLTFNILGFERDEVDTDFGSKLEFHLNVLSSSTDVVSPGKYTWRTVAKAARLAHQYFVLDKTPAENYSQWLWELVVVENGVSLKTLKLNSDPSDGTTKHGTPAPGNTTAGAGE
jgi:hypothetical protein